MIDKPPTASVAAINDMMFVNPRSVKKLWEDSSYGKATWTGTVIDVSIPYSFSSGMNTNAWADAAEAAARAQGYEPNNYTAKVTMLGIGGQNGTGGVATANGGTSRVWIYDCRDMHTTAHELGHTIGLPHASSDTNNDGIIDAEYGDGSDVMGSGQGYHINAPHAVQKGWLNPTTISANGTYTVTPVENSTGVRVYKYIPPSGSPYYFSYRQPIGFDSFTSWYDGGAKSPIGAPFTNGVNIHRFNGSSQTLYITTLNDGGVFAIPGTSAVITQNSHNGSGVTFTVTGAGGNGAISGTRRVVNQLSGKAIDNGSTTLGSGNVQWDVNNINSGNQQKWVFTQNPDTSWNIINLHTGLAMEMQSTSNGAQSKVWSSSGGSNQRWWVDVQSDGSYKIWNQWSGKSLENASSTVNGAPIIQWPWSGGGRQRWSFQ
jgi:Ricin-type beta-trefoil lectin domain-like/Gametolysin peptidase M11